MVKLKTAAPDVPEFVIDTDDPAVPVATLPRVIVAAEPVAPVFPVSPFGPVGPVAPVAPVAPVFPVSPLSPLSPRGIVKFSVADVGVPTLVTLAEDPAAPVVVVPTATDTTVGPIAPCGPSEAIEIVWVVGETTTVPPRESTIETV
jgi:hypothetical protein